MPVGVILNSGVVLIGGVIGAVLGNKLPKRVLDELPSVFGLASIAMGITFIVQLSSLTAVVLAIILGAIFGESLELEKRLTKGLNLLFKSKESDSDMRLDILITAIALFVFSGTGIFGVLNEGFTGDSSIMVTKSILDFFTAITFGATAGYLVSLVALPQFVFNMIIFFSAGFILPLINSTMLQDFRACGGIVTLAVGLKLTKIKAFKIINILPAIIIVLPLSYLWGLL